MKTVLGIDNGTQSTKVLFYNFEKREVAAVESAPHDLISKEDGTREQKCEWWIEALKAALKRVPKEIRMSAVALAVSGQQHGFVPVNREGKTLYPVKLWCDTSTTEECDEITKSIGSPERVISIGGNPILPGYTASKILWLKKRHPHLYNQMRWVLLPHDYLNFYLTGNLVAEYGDASGTALLDVRKRVWSEDICSAIDPNLSTKLPPLVEPHQFIGTLLPQRAKELGIPAGIPVAPGGGDNMMGAIGTGAVKEGTLTMSLGTSGTLYGCSDTPVIDPQGQLAAFCSSTGSWLPLLCTMNCTVATELMRKLFDYGVAEFDRLGAQAAPGAEGVITLPFFNGERTPNLPNGRGVIAGITGSNLTKENLFRSALEAAILGMKIGVHSFTSLGYNAKEIRVIGGGARSPIWRQIAADILELPIVVPLEKEAAAMGAALQALWVVEKSRENRQIGEIIEEHVALKDSEKSLPDNRNSALYRKVYSDYCSYIEALTPIYSSQPPA